MPQIIVKNVDRDTVLKVSPKITETVAKIAQVKPEHVVVEYNAVEFFRCGVKDEKCAMVWVSWKKRTKEQQEELAKSLAQIFFEEGYTPVETVYDNLDMSDFYEYFKE